MKKVLKQLSWILVVMLIVTSTNLTSLTAYASENENLVGVTDKVVKVGKVLCYNDNGERKNVAIRYYESADSDHIFKEDESTESELSDEVAGIKSTAWHFTFVEERASGISGHSRTVVYNAYPVSAFDDDVTYGTYVLPEGVDLTGANLKLSIWLGDTKLKDEFTVSDSYTLGSYEELREEAGSATFDQAVQDENFHKPVLTKLYYDVEYTNKETADSANTYTVKLTVKPTIEVAFDGNSGALSSSESKYAIPDVPVNTSELPEASYDNYDFYGWQNSTDTIYGTRYVYQNEKYKNEYYYKVNIYSTTPAALVARYIEKAPDFTIDLEAKTINGLIQGRHYYVAGTELVADANGSISYNGLYRFDISYYRNIVLKSDNDAVKDSIYVSLNHTDPDAEIKLKATSTTVTVTNPEEFEGCVYSLYDYTTWKSSEYQTSNIFTGLTPENNYQIRIKHAEDENGFESSEKYSDSVQTPAVKPVSDANPNGVTIEDIADQVYTNTPKQPVLTIKDGETVLTKDTDYTVEYSNNIAVTTGSAIATVTFMDSYSGTMTKYFSIVPKAEAPAISPNGGDFMDTQSVSITCATQGAVIYYTTNGDTPTKESKLYTGPFIIDSSVTVKAIAIKANLFDSDITSAVFTKTSIPVSNDEPNGVTISDIPDQIFNGNPAQPALTVKYGNTVLAKDTDYTVEYSNNTAVTTNAVATVTFMGNYSGSMTKSFSIIINSNNNPVVINPPKNNNNSGQTGNNNNGGSTNNNTTITIKIGQKLSSVNGEEKDIDVEPMLINDRTIVPARFIAESLGAIVKWDKSSPDDVIIELDDIKITLHIGDIYADVNGRKIKLDCAPFIKNDRTFAPLRFIAETLGYEVNWNAETEEITITKKN